MRKAAAALALAGLLLGVAGCNPQPPPASVTTPAASTSAGMPASPRASAAGPPTPAPSPSPTALPIAVHARGTGRREATFVEQSHNRKVYVVRASSSDADRLPDGSFNVALNLPFITFYDQDGKSLRGNAPHATITHNGKTVTMTGGVRAVNSDGVVLTCDTMTYYQATEKIHGEGHVVLVNPAGDTLTGQTIDADIRFDHVVLNGSP